MSQDPYSNDNIEVEEEKFDPDQDQNQPISKEIQDVILYLLNSEKIKRQIIHLLRKKQPELHHDFNVDLIDFFDEAPQFIRTFFNEPKLLIQYFQQGIIVAQQKVQSDLQEQMETQNHFNTLAQELDILENNLIDQEVDELGELKESIQIKFMNVPYTQNIYKKNLSDLDTYDLDKIVVISGTVIRQSQRKPLQKQKTYKCKACGFEYILQADFENYNQFILPLKCRNSVQKPKKENPFTMGFKQKGFFGGNKGKQQQAKQKFVDQMCGGKQFEEVEASQVYVDYQEVRIQEPFKTIKSGTIPKTIWVLLEGTLVDNVKPGEDVIITGILIKRNKKLVKDSRPDLMMAIVGNNIEVKSQDTQHSTDEQSLENDMKQNELFEEIQFFWSNAKDIYSEIEARNMIIKSACPHIYQKYDIKLSMLLCLIGGVSGVQNNTRIRGQCHMFLVGEPGTGKSQILKYAAKLSQRSVFTNGIGTTSAGLTVSHTKEGGEWMLEAGALVLADKGVCCIDEFNLIKKQDFASVLEAMEQQTISGFKAGTMSKLNTRTTVIAAANPITVGQKYNPQYDLSNNTGLSSPLLSRFDLIFVVIDECNYEADTENCDFILGRFMPKDPKQKINNSYLHEQSTNHQQQQKDLWEVDKLREYISFIKQKFAPTVNQAAQYILVKYYNHLRGVEEMHSKTTIRTLESLVRLSQGHARLMFKNEVEVFDAVCIIVLMECAFNTNLFPNIPLSDYIILNYEKYMEIEQMVQSRLEIQDINNVQ